MDRLLAIYPTALKVEELLKRTSLVQGCQMGYRVMTFPQLVDGLWREGADQRAAIGPIGERLALEQAIAELNRHATVIPSTPGLRDHLRTLIRQAKSTAVKAADLRDAAQKLSKGPRFQLASYAAVMDEYETVLRERGLADTHQRESTVLELLHRAETTGSRPSFLRGVERLMVAEIYDLSLLQFMIVASLIRIIGDAEVTIQAEPHKVSAARFSDLTWNRFVAEASIADNVLPQFVRRGGRSGGLGFVLEHIFTEQYPEPPPRDDSIKVVEAPDAMREAEETAREIRRMLERPEAERFALNRIAVIARDLTPYADYLGSAFRRYGIPLHIVQPKALRTATPARVILNLLQIPSQGYPREALVSLCQAPYLRFSAQRYRNVAAETGYIDRRTRPLSECIAAYREEASDTSATPAAAAGARLQHRLSFLDGAQAAWRELLATLEALDREGKAAEHAGRLYAALDQLGFDPAANLGNDDARAVGGVARALEALVEDANRVAPGKVLSLEEFTSLLEDVFLGAASDRSESAAGVRALPVLDARGLDFDLVFIIGLNDGVFPRYHPEDPLLSDELVRAINPWLAGAVRRRLGQHAPDAPGPLLRTSYDRNAEEPFLFFLALSMPARALVLSYATTDERGNPQQRSPFVDEVARLLRANGEDIVTRLHAADFIASAENCFTAKEFLERAASDRALAIPRMQEIGGGDRAESVVQRTAIERARESYLQMPTRQEREKSEEASPSPKVAAAGVHDGNVGPDPRLRRMLLENQNGTPRRWGASQLSEAATCGFKYFARRVLLLREKDEPDYEQSALEIGQIAHDILDRISKKHIDLGDPESALEIARGVLEQEHLQRASKARAPAFFSLAWSNLVGIVEEVIAYEALRRAEGAPAPSEQFSELEISFALRERGAGAAAERINVEIEGRVDRLELYRDRNRRISHIRLVDYKTSRNPSRYEKLLRKDQFARKDFQMAVYAIGALTRFRGELARAPTVEPVYLVLRSRDKEVAAVVDLELCETDPDRREKLVSEGAEPFADRMIGLVAAATAGRFDVDPLECSDYCPYRRVCRYYKPAAS